MPSIMAACLALGGCAAALELASGAPPRLYELTPKSTFADNLPAVDARLAVEVPTATAGLNNARIALRPTPTTLEYYARASWIDVVPVMMQNLLLESLDNAGTIDVLDRGVVGVRADYALLTHVREFQAEYDDQRAPAGPRPPPGPPGAPAAAHLARLDLGGVRGARRRYLRCRPSSTRSTRRFGKALKRIVEWTLIEAAKAQAEPVGTQPT